MNHAEYQTRILHDSPPTEEVSEAQKAREADGTPNQEINGMNACGCSPKSTPNTRMVFGGYECHLGIPRVAFVVYEYHQGILRSVPAIA